MAQYSLNSFRTRFRRAVVKFLVDCNIAAAVIGKESFHAMFEVLAEGASGWIPSVRYMLRSHITRFGLLLLPSRTPFQRSQDTATVSLRARSVNKMVEEVAREGEKDTACLLQGCEFVYVENDVWTVDQNPMGAHAMLCRGINADGTLIPNLLVGVTDVTDKRHLATVLADNCCEVSFRGNDHLGVVGPTNLNSQRLLPALLPLPDDA